MPEFRSREGVEIARVGTYRLATGNHTFTRAQLASAVAAANTEGALAPRLKLGHVDKRFDGEPAIGRVRNLRLTDDGEAIVADYTDMPPWLADALDSAYPGRSIEAAVMGDNLRITGVALLGVVLPGISTLKDLETRLSDTGPLAVAAGEDTDGRYIEIVVASTEEAAQKVGELVDATQADSRPDLTNPKEESGMDPKELRRSIGLAEDASDEDVKARLDALNARPESTDGLVPQADVDQKVEEAVAAARAEERSRIEASGGVVMDAAEADKLKADAAAGREARDEQIAAGRETFITAAVKAGKFPPARRDHYLALMAKDETGTREFIDKLEAGAIPVTEIGAAGGSEDSGGEPTTTGWFPSLQEA